MITWQVKGAQSFTR